MQKSPHSSAYQQFLTPLFFAILTIVIATLMKLPELAAQLATGTHVFNDTDDAMRLVQVRDYLAGQSWWDVRQYRLNPPEGSLMHWSRLIDLPIIFFLLILDPILSPIPAEIVTRTFLPWCMLLIFSFVYFRLCVKIAGTNIYLPALVVIVMNFYVLGQFAPGRIDHHNVQLIGVILLLYCLFTRKSSFQNGALIGIIMAVMMAIGIETLPFSVGIGLILVLNWVFLRQTHQMFGFALSLLVCVWGIFFATQPAAHFHLPYCDALGGPIIVLFSTVATGLMVCAAFNSVLHSLILRLGAAILCGVAGILSLTAYAPQCLASPYKAVHPTLQAEWLSKVSEAQPFFKVFHSAPSTGVSILYSFVAVSLIMAWLIHVSRKINQQDAIKLCHIAILLGISIATTFWQIRAVMVFGVVSMIVACYFVMYIEILNCVPRLKSVRRILALIPFSPAIAVIVYLQFVPDVVAKVSSLKRCTNLEAIEKLNAQKTGIVWSSIDLGPSILAFTQHSVVAAPYHRNNLGNLKSVLLQPKETEQFLSQMKHFDLKYGYICAKHTDIEEIKPKLLPFVNELYSDQYLLVFERK